MPYAFDRVTFVTCKPSKRKKTWAIFWPYTADVRILLLFFLNLIAVTSNSVLFSYFQISCICAYWTGDSIILVNVIARSGSKVYFLQGITD